MYFQELFINLSTKLENFLKIPPFFPFFSYSTLTASPVLSTFIYCLLTFYYYFTYFDYVFNAYLFIFFFFYSLYFMRCNFARFFSYFIFSLSSGVASAVSSSNFSFLLSFAIAFLALVTSSEKFVC